MSVSTLTLVCDVLKNQMVLSADQIWIYNQKQNIPVDSRLYVIVSLVSAMPYASGKKYSFATNMRSTTHQHVQETIRVDLLSAGPDAINRVQEVVGALASDYAEQVAFANGLRFALIPTSIVDSSAAEVTRMLFRMTVEFKVLRAYTQTKTVPHYDTFTSQIRTEKGILP
jgi:hypothetical protein